MHKIRHIAISSQNPAATAAFYKEAFGWEEITRMGLDADHQGEAPRPSGVIMTDGSINITILKFGTDQIGKGLDFEGVHHLGVVVDDWKGERERLEAMGARCVTDEHDVPEGAQFEIKFQCPDDIIFDITDVPYPGSFPLAGVTDPAAHKP
ncbi:MAG: VOC family protein [Rhodospirillales bacterium]|nr:VOC family protein [Rhodospirillales bacterium]